MPSIHLSIPEIPTGLNGPKGLLRMHWSKRVKVRERWSWLVRAALGYPALLEKSPERARVTITIYRKRLMDVDNLHSSVKHLLDGLVYWNCIQDDDPYHCQLIVKQQKVERGNIPHTDITVETLEDSNNANDAA